MTYVTRQEVEVQEPHVAEFEGQQTHVNAGLQTITGFEERQLLRSLAHPARYALLTFWQSNAAAARAVQTELLPAWVVSVRPVEAYEQVHDITDSRTGGGTPGYIWLNDWILTDADTFLASRKEIAGFFQQNVDGYLRWQLLRCVDDGTRHLVISTWSSLEASEAGHRKLPPELSAKYPAALFTSSPVVTENYSPVLLAIPT